EECGEVRRVHKHDISRALLTWRHPQQAVKLPVSSGGEGMRTVEINRLACQQMHRLAVLLGDFVVWQMGMKIESWDVFKEAQLINVAERGERCDLLGAFDLRWTETVEIVRRDIVCFH